jgi:hypothetical protein
MATVEEQDVQFAVVMADLDDAWAVFSRHIAHVLDEEGREGCARPRAPDAPLYLPVRFLQPAAELGPTAPARAGP